MSLSDFAVPAGHATHDRSGFWETILGWLNHSTCDRVATENPVDERGPVHRIRETGYLRDIGI